MKKATLIIAVISLMLLMACKSEKKESKEIENSSSIEKELDKALEEELSSQDTNSSIETTEQVPGK